MKNKALLILKWVLLIIIVGCIVYAVYSSKQNSVIKNELNNSQSKEVVPVVKNVSGESNVATYSSPLLGVKFQYAIKDPMFEGADPNKVIEKGNEITTTGGGTVKVFSKDPKISLENEIKTKLGASDCKVVIENDSIREKLGHVNFDTMLRVVYPDARYGGAGYILVGENLGDIGMSVKDKKCSDNIKYIPSYVLADKNYPDRFITVEASSQAPEGVLFYVKNGKVTPWMSTVEFIPVGYKDLTTDYFSVSYPNYLIASEHKNSCGDGSVDKNCQSNSFWQFVNNKYINEHDSSRFVDVIYIYFNFDVKKSDLGISNQKEVLIGENNFIMGDTKGDVIVKEYWIQGNGYALQIVRRTPSANPKYNGYIDLASLKLK